MSGEMERPGIEGKVIKDGIAQTTTRVPGGVQVELLRVPGHQAEQGGGVQKITFPEPVTVAAGECMTVSVGWLPGVRPASAPEVSMPAVMRNPAVITSVLLPAADLATQKALPAAREDSRERDKRAGQSANGGTITHPHCEVT